MSKLDLDAQYELAARIQNLIMFVGLLTPDEIDALKELKENLHSSNSSLGAVAGILAPLEESEHKISRQRAMIKRIDAFLALAETNQEMQDADAELDKAKKGRDTINALFGL